MYVTDNSQTRKKRKTGNALNWMIYAMRCSQKIHCFKVIKYWIHNERFAKNGNVGIKREKY